LFPYSLSYLDNIEKLLQDGIVEFMGILKVKVIKGTNLAIRDMMSSDPYVIVALGKQVSEICIFILFFSTFISPNSSLRQVHIIISICKIRCGSLVPCQVEILFCLFLPRIILITTI
jgi:hypothetical protein